jgi:hypothetical protein
MTVVRSVYLDIFIIYSFGLWIMHRIRMLWDGWMSVIFMTSGIILSTDWRYYLERKGWYALTESNNRLKKD